MVATVVLGSAYGCLAGLGFGFGLGVGGKPAKKPEKVPYQLPYMSPGQAARKGMSPGGMLSSPTAAGMMSAGAERGSAAKLDFSKTTLTSRLADLDSIKIRQSLDVKGFEETLRQLVGHAKNLQNNPRLGVTPQERLAADVVIKALASVSGANGPLVIEELEYVKNRPNLKITYPGRTDRTVSFMGSHMDVVPADPESWSRDPFTLTVEGDKMYGRGTTDCLGHVALLTRFLYELGSSKPELDRTVVVVFIAAEEGGETGVGVDMCVKSGKLDNMKKGPVYWCDVADSEPCLGTVGSLSWSMTAKGRLFHSGFPHKGINSIELAGMAMDMIQERFYEDFPRVDKEETYLFAIGSSLKPTQIECKKGSFNQICPETTYHGDIRLSPFYGVREVMEKIDEYVEWVNTEIERMPTRGPYSKFTLAEDIEIQAGERRRGVVEWKWGSKLEEFLLYEGVACDLESAGHKALVQAFREVKSSVKPFAINGTLPLVKSMKDAGFDLQLCGFGLLKVYHGIDEYIQVQDFERAYEVVARVVALLDKHA